MKNYPIEKYEFEIRQHPEYLGVETIAKSTYAGKEVFGKAICRADDSYNEENPMAKWDSGLWIRYKLFENVMDKIHKEVIE